MKIYTRTGDDGTTALFGSGRVRKDHLRIAGYGTVDETNSAIGVALATLAEEPKFDFARSVLERIQNELFVIGGDLAAPDETTYPVPRLGSNGAARIESDIDEIEAALPPLKNFILPGGHPGAASLHLARTVCRRAERILVALQDEETINPAIVPYMNRLSDLLFSLARWINVRSGINEKPWISSAT